MGDFEDAAAEIVDCLGSPIVYFDHSDIRQINGVFSNGFQKVEGPRGPAIASRRPEMSIRTDVITEPVKGDKIYRGTLESFEGCFDYEVASVRDDEEDTVVNLVLKKTT